MIYQVAPFVARTFTELLVIKSFVPNQVPVEAATKLLPLPKSKLIFNPEFVDVSQVPDVSPVKVTVFLSQVFALLIVYVCVFPLV